MPKEKEPGRTSPVPSSKFTSGTRYFLTSGREMSKGVVRAKSVPLMESSSRNQEERTKNIKEKNVRDMEDGFRWFSN